MTFRRFPSARSEWARRDHARRLLATFPERLAGVVAAVVAALADGPAPSLRKLRSTVRAALGRCSDGDVDAAVELLGACVRRTRGLRGATRYTLDVDALPREFRERLAQRAGKT
jgi:hypothetical protein